MADFRYYPDLTEAELLAWRRKLTLSELGGEVMSTSAGDQANTKRRALSTDELKRRINHDLGVLGSTSATDAPQTVMGVSFAGVMSGGLNTAEEAE